MTKYNGPKKIKTAVFISGTGSNLKNLIKFSKQKNCPISINLIISNKANAKGLAYGDIFKIKKKVFNFSNRIFTEKKILSLLVVNKIRLICLAGFMKILSRSFIKKFNGKILNIHPSLLPKYKGLNTHARALKNHDKFTGCTIHLVNSKLDSGKIILQKKVKIFKNDNIKTLSKRVLKQEHKLYPAALNKLFS